MKLKGEIIEDYQTHSHSIKKQKIITKKDRKDILSIKK